MFEKIKCFILDMDGTSYLGNELFSFTKDFLKKVEETGREYYFFTNNSSKSQQDYIEKLERFGIRIKSQQTGYEPDEIAIVGDRLYTDIAVADQSDVTSILVLSGESTREDVKTSDVKPNVILEDLSEIIKML